MLLFKKALVECRLIPVRVRFRCILIIAVVCRLAYLAHFMKCEISGKMCCAYKLHGISKLMQT